MLRRLGEKSDYHDTPYHVVPLRFYRRMDRNKFGSCRQIPGLEPVDITDVHLLCSHQMIRNISEQAVVRSSSSILFPIGEDFMPTTLDRRPC